MDRQQFLKNGSLMGAALCMGIPVGTKRGITLNNCNVQMGPRFKIDISKDGKERQFPCVFKFGSNIFVSYSEHHDSKIKSPVDAMMISRDNGKTWTRKITNRNFRIHSMIEQDGMLYAISYVTYPGSPTKERMFYWTSADRGKTWAKHEGIVHAPNGKKFTTVGGGVWASVNFHRGMKVMDDGSIQGVMYGRYEDDIKYRSIWVKSTDNCATWQIVSTIASRVPSDKFKKADGYCEPTFAKVRDGSLLCVMRINSYMPLFQARSYDKGLTWTKPVMLPGLSPKASQSVDPHLLLMKNGILALSYGRPGDKIAFSGDGCGHKWCSLDSYTGETTGYTGIVEVDPGKLLLVADQGRTGAKEMAIWGRLINVKI